MSEKPTYDINKLARVYAKIRDAKEAASAVFKKQDEEYKAQLEMLSTTMLQCLGDTQGVRTKDGLQVFKQKDIKPQVRDWDLLYQWIVEDPDRFEVLERRVKKTFVAAYREEHKDDEDSNVPGVSVIEEYKVIVRKG